MKNIKKLAHDMSDPFWFQKLGGRSRMAKLTKKQRSELGKDAVMKRWNEYHKKHPKK